MSPTMKLFCRWALLIALILQVNGAVYRLDPANPQGFLVQNAKPSVAYIFVPPHTSQSTGLAVQSLKLEARLRWAKIPYHKISNQFFLGSPTDGSTPFVQFDGKYLEGEEKIFTYLKEECDKRRKGEEIDTGGQNEEQNSISGQREGPAATEEKKDADKKTTNKISNAVSKAWANLFKPVEESDILHSAKVLTNILIADRVHLRGITYMLEDLSLKQQIAPILFALSRAKNGNESAPAGASSSLASLSVGEHDGSGSGWRGEPTAAEDVAKEEAAEKAMEISRRLAKGKMLAMEEEQGDDVAKPTVAKMPEQLVLDRPLLKEYFALKNTSNAEARHRFLIRHQLLLEDNVQIQRYPEPEIEDIVEVELVATGQRHSVADHTWALFDFWLQNQLKHELEPYLFSRVNVVESSWRRFLAPQDVEVQGSWKKERKSYLECTEDEMLQVFKKVMEPVLKQLDQMDRFEEKKKSEKKKQLERMEKLKEFERMEQLKKQKEPTAFLFGSEPTEADAHLFAVLLQYHRLSMNSRMNQKKIREYLTADLNYYPSADHHNIHIWAGSHRRSQQYAAKLEAAENARLIRNYIDNLGPDVAWTSTSKQVPFPAAGAPLEQLSAFYGEKYNGPFRIAPTDNLHWLPDFDLSKIESKEIHRLLAEHGAKENAELLALVLKKEMFNMRTGKFKWGELEIGIYGEDLLHLVAAYLCNLSGKEEPAGGENLENVKAMEEQEEKAKQCSQKHLMLIDGGQWQTLLHEKGPFTELEWKVGVRMTIYEAVVEYNEGLVEARVKQAILEAAKEGRRAEHGLGIEMF